MGKFKINGNFNEFWGGSIAGGVTSGGFIFSQSFFVNIFLLDFTLKLLSTAMVAGVTGLITVLAADFYKHKLKNRIFKTKKNGKMERDDEERVA